MQHKTDRAHATTLSERMTQHLRSWFQACIERGKTEPYTITVKLSPALAGILLETNHGNRSISERISEYVRDIASGKWIHNGETIVISDTGELNDGQHRCMAVVKAGLPITTEMTFGVSRNSRRTVDSGIKRTVSANLNIAGFSDTNVLAHGARVILTFTEHKQINSNPGIRPSNQEIQDWCDAHPEIQGCIKRAREVRKSCHCSIGLFAALHYIFSQRHARFADIFFEKLATGEMLKTNDPIHQLREFLNAEAASRRKLSEEDVAAHAIKAWNYYRKERPIKKIVWRDKKHENETFPIPV